MRTPRRLAWLNIADGTVVVVLMWYWVYRDSRHDLLDAATMGTLLIGFLAGAPGAARGLRRARTAGSEAAPGDDERRDALLLFPAERAEGPDGPERTDTPTPPSHAPGVRPAWLTIVAHAVVMIALTWRWAFQNEPYTILGAVTLSTLMLGFLEAAGTVVESLGRAGQPRAVREREPQDALLLFPVEDSSADDLVLTPQLLATRRKALL